MLGELSSIICRVCEGNDVLMYILIRMIIDTAKDSLPEIIFQRFIDCLKGALNSYL